jgi:hypothetical protein
MFLLSTKGSWGVTQQGYMQLTHKVFPHVTPHLGGCLIKKKLK